MRVKTWRVIEWGDVPRGTVPSLPLDCTCGVEAYAPVVGRVVAVTHGTSVIFDNDAGPHQLPPTIQCRRCGRVYGQTGDHVR